MALPLFQAAELAEYLRAEMEPYCDRIAIAGSIRRRVDAVRDLEIVAIPRWEQRLVRDGLFEVPQRVNTLHEWALASRVRWIKPGTPSDVIIDWTPKPDGRYWRGLVGNAHLDLFLAQPDNWGVILTIRTGSREFSAALARHAQQCRRPFAGGALHEGAEDGPILPTPEEATVFELLGLEMPAPTERTGPEALRRRVPAAAAEAGPESWELLEKRRRELLDLAGRHGCPRVVLADRTVICGRAVWGYEITAARPERLAELERALQALQQERPVA